MHRGFFFFGWGSVEFGMGARDKIMLTVTEKLWFLFY